MSYTKRHYEKYFNQLENQIELFYHNLEQELWYQPKHTDEKVEEESYEDYYRELEDTRFIEDLNFYWENRNEIWD